MAQPHSPPAVKWLCGMISSRPELFDRALGPLSESFGPIDLVSESFPFDLTHYYDPEMGSPLHRRFVSFERPTDASELASVKLRTNQIEARFAALGGPGGPPRPLNLDPGYVEVSKLILASMKNFSHRIYLGQGVFAEITLMYRKGIWEPLPWTFPDYASHRYDAYLTAVRDRLRQR